MDINDFDEVVTWCWTCPKCGHYNEIEGDTHNLSKVYCEECSHIEQIER